MVRSSLLIAGALFVFAVACPGAFAQVPTPQTGGSGQTPDAAADTPAKKPDAPAKDTSKKKTKKAAPAAKTTAKTAVTPTASAEPDKVLYDRAQADLKHARYTEGRLALQTLINTYPDSEYRAKAKLAVADSYFNEGGTSNLTQAIQEYNDFQTFFPFLDEAAYAQMQIGLAHYHMMEKSDRDKTQGEAAEDAFQAFLLKYPTNALAPKATQYLRDTQEVLADGDYKIAYFYYYTKQDYRASAARLVELTDRYPLYSQNDQALWMLGDVYDRAKNLSKSEDDKNHWGDLAAKCYDKIVRDYPLSKLGPQAAARLKAMGRPVPQADPNAYARMKDEEAYQRQHHQIMAIKMPLSMVKGTPDVSTAAHSGTPQLNPPNDVVSATDVLRPGAQGPAFTVTAGGANSGAAETSTEVVTPEDARTVPAGADPQQTGVGVEIISTGSDAQPATTPQPQGAASPETNAPGTTASPAPVNPAPDANAAVATTPAANAQGTTPATTTSAPAPEGSTPPVSSSSANSTGTPAGGGEVAPDKTAPAKLAPADSKEESTSKKKKGIKKIIPW